MTGAADTLPAVNHGTEDSAEWIMSPETETLREFSALFETLNREAERNRVRALCKQ